MARNPLSAAIHTMVTICEMSAYAPSGAQKPWLAQVVPPSKTSTTATTPAEKNRFEMIPARWSPNAPDMTNIAAGNEPITVRTHPRSENPDVTAREAEPAIENASAARTAIRMNNTAAAAVLPRCNPRSEPLAEPRITEECRMAKAALGCPANPAPDRRPVTSLIGSLEPGRALASRLTPCCLGWERQGYRCSGRGA